MTDAQTTSPPTSLTQLSGRLVDDARKGVKLRNGVLADLAPTMLALLGIPQPPEMTGKSLIVG